MDKITKFLKSHISDIFLVILIIFFIYTGKFYVLKDRVEAWFGKSKGIQVQDMTFNYIQDNKTVKLSDLKGKVVLINFWATWCPPCKIEIPSFVDIYSKANKSKFELVGVSVDNTGADSVKQFINNSSINYPVTMTTQDISSKFDPIIAVPTSYLLDRNGKIVKKYSGLYMKSTFENDIKELIN